MIVRRVLTSALSLSLVVGSGAKPRTASVRALAVVRTFGATVNPEPGAPRPFGVDVGVGRGSGPA
jgi:hypothetical protein